MAFLLLLLLSASSAAAAAASPAAVDILSLYAYNFGQVAGGEQMFLPQVASQPGSPDCNRDRPNSCVTKVEMKMRMENANCRLGNGKWEMGDALALASKQK